jgi:hypothetical protein
MTLKNILSPRFNDTTERSVGQRIVLICDWLPPDFGAVGQYTIQRAEQLASDGQNVTVIGFSSGVCQAKMQSIPELLTVLRVTRKSYNKTQLFQRAIWTIRANFALLWAASNAIKNADEVIFTGSPPYFLHFIVPINILFWRKKLVYRITDFHPEWLDLIYQMTLFWRRRVAIFEAIGADQMVRLREIGIPAERMRLVRDPAPVLFAAGLIPMARPLELKQSGIILYSGNFGIAHDHQTFLQGYAKFLASFPGRAKLWLNAVESRHRSIGM